MSESPEMLGTTAIPKRAPKSDRPRRVAALTVIAHPEPSRVGDRAILSRSRASPLSRAQPDFAPPGTLIGRGLGDPYISREPVHLLPTGKDGWTIDPGVTKTRVAVAGKPIAAAWTITAASIARGTVITLAERVTLVLHLCDPELPVPRSDHPITGASDAVLELHREIARVADLETPVLLRGPSGSGKELAARAIHDAGPPNRPFISVNMGAIPPNLAASELFGAVKGSFTGADRNQQGYFRAAEGGTLFLDEVGEAPAEVQVLLLRALENGEISPVGAQRPVPVRVRLIAATDADLESLIADADFKAPLFHRLAGYEIHLPPLTERLEDLGRLFFHFARLELTAIGASGRLIREDPYAAAWLPAELMERLASFSWPGNIRQLRNLVRQLVIGCREAANLSLVPRVEAMLRDPAPSPEPTEPSPGPRGRKPAAIDEAEVTEVLRVNRWDIKAAADDLGISRGALYALIDKIPGIHIAADLEHDQIRAALTGLGGDIEAAADSLAVSARALRRRMRTLGIEIDRVIDG